MDNAELSNRPRVVKAVLITPLNHIPQFPKLCAIMCTMIQPAYSQVYNELAVKKKSNHLISGDGGYSLPIKK